MTNLDIAGELRRVADGGHRVTLEIAADDGCAMMTASIDDEEQAATCICQADDERLASLIQALAWALIHEASNLDLEAEREKLIEKKHRASESFTDHDAARLASVTNRLYR